MKVLLRNLNATPTKSDNSPRRLSILGSDALGYIGTGRIVMMLSAKRKSFQSIGHLKIEAPRKGNEVTRSTASTVTAPGFGRRIAAGC